MGLDMCTAKNYIRANWAGVQSFDKWCEDENLPDPFPGWNGNNMEVMKYSEHKGDWEKWCKEFADRFPELVSEEGPAHMIQMTSYIGDESRWEKTTALAYYVMLTEVLENQTDIKMW